MTFAKQLLIALVVFPFAAVLSQADDSTINSAASPFRSGDRVAFVGDSISAWGQYTSIIQLFCQTRFPEQTFRIYNNALAGDRALFTRLRAEESGGPFHHDILRNQPNVAVVMLGMNDAKNADVWTQPDELKRERREKAANEYRDSMDELLGKLQTGGVKRILLVVSCPYDETTDSDRPVMRGKNDFIREVTVPYLRSASQNMKTPLVDFNEPMLAINIREQKTDPKFSLADLGDRVHPLERGHFVMAYEFLRQMQISPHVAQMEIDAASTQVQRADNCVVSELQKTDNGVQFDCLAKSLPFPTTEFQFDGVVPFDEHLNQELLRVTNLPAGSFALKIDEAAVGRYSAAELRAGVNLALNPNTPQYRQAIEVKKMSARSWLKGNSKRHLVGYLRLMHIRRLESKEKQLAFMRSRQRPGKGISQQREAEFVRLLEEEGLEESIAASIHESESLNDQAWKAAVPKKHHYQLFPTHPSDGDDSSNSNRPNEGSGPSGFDLKAPRKTGLER